jgi:hypothetical protein
MFSVVLFAEDGTSSGSLEVVKDNKTFANSVLTGIKPTKHWQIQFLQASSQQNIGKFNEKSI